MGNALIQLVATGPQNVILNAQPESTLFKGVFKRITMFAIESVSQTFNGSVGFGNKVTSMISRNGDLLSKMLLEVQLPAVSATVSGWTSGDDDTYTIKWVDNVGYHLLQEVEVEIGGISIVKHYGRWMHIWQELTRPGSKDTVHSNMVGNGRSDLTTGAVTTSANGTVTLAAPRKLYIPLQFWFCNNYALAFPLIACVYHDVKVNITFNSLSNLVDSYITAVGGADGQSITAPTASSALDATLYVDYIFLENEERRNFASASHEYLIEQLQYPSAESHSGQSSVIRRLDGFNHPVKEIVWVVQLDSVLSAGSGRNPNDFGNAGAQMVTDAKLVLNGNDRFSTRSGDYFNWVQPYNHHTRGPATGINVYSFSTDPEKHQPTGTCNFSRIDTAQLQMTLGNTAASKSHVYMVNYNVLRVVSGLAGLAFAA
jgi:hypothetical protein